MKKYEGLKRMLLVEAARLCARVQAKLLSKASGGEPFWVDTYGRVWKLPELSDQHLRGIINKMSRDEETDHELYQHMLEELKQRGYTGRRGSPHRWRKVR